MKVDGETREAVFLGRLKRFSALVELGGKEEIAYLPNTGRIWQLFSPGQKVFLVKRDSNLRKTKWDLYLFPSAQTLVWADPRAANSLVFEALRKGFLLQFRGFHSIHREATFKGNRFDFLLANNDQRYFLEAKSVTLVREGRALFPDAPTQRGAKQLEALLEARKEGYEAGVVFIIQREDACVFSPNEEIDVRFSRTLCRAVEAGIDVYAYNTKVRADEINLGEEVIVSLGCLARKQIQNL
jgi:sugar fermentation stimulation protein A